MSETLNLQDNPKVKTFYAVNACVDWGVDQTLILLSTEDEAEQLKTKLKEYFKREPLHFDCDGKEMPEYREWKDNPPIILPLDEEGCKRWLLKPFYGWSVEPVLILLP